MISTDESREPRFQISDNPNTQQAFDINVDGLKPGDIAIIDKMVFDYSLKSISNIPTGEYWVQALLHRYETFHRVDGLTAKLPMDMGEGQLWNRIPGTLYSTPQKLKIDPGKDEVIEINIEKKFRGTGQGWARFLYSGSTGGWEALAEQVFYPNEYNRCYAACPDPFDFRADTIVNIYEHKNAYYVEGNWKQTPRPG